MTKGVPVPNGFDQVNEAAFALVRENVAVVQSSVSGGQFGEAAKAGAATAAVMIGTDQAADCITAFRLGWLFFRAVSFMMGTSSRFVAVLDVD